MCGGEASTTTSTTSGSAALNVGVDEQRIDDALMVVAFPARFLRH
jgi:hypothetical protein